MTQTKKSTAAASRKGAAARAEKAKGKKQVEFEFRGQKLSGPADLPGTFDFDLGDLQIRAEAGEDTAWLIGVHRLVESVIGRDQMLKVRTTIKNPSDPWQRDLLEALLGAYGSNAGEAEASAAS